MKIIQVASSIIFLMLSGCAHTEYRHGYAGYGGGYTVERSYGYGGYGSYGGSYFSPGTSFIYERSYLQPRFDRHHYREHDHYPDRHHELHRNWQGPSHQPRHFDGGHGDWSHRRDRHTDGVNRQFGPRDRDAEHVPHWTIERHRQPISERHGMPERHRQDFQGNRRHGDGGRRGRSDGHNR